MIYNPAQLPGVVDIAIRRVRAPQRGPHHGAQRYSGRRRRRRPLAARGPGPPAADRAGLAPGPGTAAEEDLRRIAELLVGTNFPYTKHLPEAGKVRVAQIEADPARAGGRIATELPVVGDAKEGLARLLPMLTCDGGTIATWAARHWARSCGSRWCSATRSTVSAIRSRS